MTIMMLLVGSHLKKVTIGLNFGKGRGTLSDILILHGEVDTFRNLNDGDEYVYYLPGTISESAVLEGIDITQKLLETVRKVKFTENY